MTNWAEFVSSQTSFFWSSQDKPNFTACMTPQRAICEKQTSDDLRWLPFELSPTDFLDLNAGKRLNRFLDRDLVVFKYDGELFVDKKGSLNPEPDNKPSGDAGTIRPVVCTACGMCLSLKMFLFSHIEHIFEGHPLPAPSVIFDRGSESVIWCPILLIRSFCKVCVWLWSVDYIAGIISPPGPSWVYAPNLCCCCCCCCEVRWALWPLAFILFFRSSVSGRPRSWLLFGTWWIFYRCLQSPPKEGCK